MLREILNPNLALVIEKSSVAARHRDIAHMQITSFCVPAYQQPVLLKFWIVLAKAHANNMPVIIEAREHPVVGMRLGYINCAHQCIVCYRVCIQRGALCTCIATQNECACKFVVKALFFFGKASHDETNEKNKP